MALNVTVPPDAGPSTVDQPQTGSVPEVQSQNQPSAPSQQYQAPQQQTQVATQPQPEPPTHHHALAGVLSAIAGPPPPVHQIDPQTGQMQTLPGKDGPGDAFRRILAGALTGMGAGAAAGATGHPGAGILGGIGAGGTAVMNRQQALNQQDIENQQKQFDEQQKAQLNKATIAHLNAEGVSQGWQAKLYQAEINDKTQKMASDLGKMIGENPNNKDYGEYASWPDFLQKHPEIAPDTAEQQGAGNLIHYNVYGEDGKVKAVHVIKYDPAFMEQTNPEPFTFAVQTGPKDTDIKTFTVQAHAMKMSDLWKSATSLEGDSIKAAIPKTDMDRGIRDIMQANGWDDTPANRVKARAQYETMTKVTPAITINEAKREAGPTSAQEFAQKKEALAIAEKPLGADFRLSAMESNLKDALAGNQQAMVSLLTNHIGMTLGLQKGARITKDILNEAAKSQPWLANIKAKWSSDGYLEGITLGPKQMREMVDLARQQRGLAWDEANSKARYMGIELPKTTYKGAGAGPGGGGPPGAPPSLHINPQTKEQIYWDGKAWVPWTGQQTAPQ